MTRLACLLLAVAALALARAEEPVPAQPTAPATAAAVTGASPLAFLALDAENVQAARVIVKKLTFTDVSARPSIVDGVLHLRDLRGDATGGTVTGWLTYDLVSQDMICELALKDIDLRAFLAQISDSDDLPTGVLSGTVRLEMPGSYATGLRGVARLTVEQGRLVDMPMLASWVVGNPIAGPAGDRLTMTMHIGREQARFDDVVMTGPSMVLTAAGTLTFEGMLDVTVRPRARPWMLSVLPGVGDVIGWTLGTVTGTLGRMRVTGHLSDPVTSMAPF